MALGFFRKWQRAIILFLVALMLVGFVGGVGLKLLTGGAGSNDIARGESKYGKLMQRRDVSLADQDMRDLAVFLQSYMRSTEFTHLRQNTEGDVSVAYALLVQDARAAGHEVGEAEVDSYLASIGLKVDEAGYRTLLTRVNRRNSGTSEPALRAALARWLMVLRAYHAFQVASPSSEIQLRGRFRDLNETLKLRILKVPAENYVANVLAPTPQQIQKQFNSYRVARPGVYPQGDSFGFGYAQLARVVVAYLLVNNDVIARVNRPGDRDVRDYFRANLRDFTKEVPVTTTTQPVAPTTAPGATTQPKVETRTVPMDINDIDEAWDQVVDRLSGWAAESKTEEFTQLVQTSIDAQLGLVSADPELYKNVYGKLIDGSQVAATLSKMVPADDISALRGKTLDKAIPALALVAGLDAICYPWGTDGEFSVSKDVRIPQSLQADGPRTLGAILDEITRLVFTAARAEDAATTKPATTKPAKKEAVPAPQYPKLKWTACRGFANILFPIGNDEGMTLLPISTGQTELVNARQLSKNEEIGRARSSRRGRGKSLLEAAMKAKPLVPGQVMYAPKGTGLRRILWQVIKSQPAVPLEKLTDAVRKEVIADYKLLEGYMTPASKAADAIAEKARSVGLEAAAKAEKMETIVTIEISRVTAISRPAEIRQSVMQQAIKQVLGGGGLPEGQTFEGFMAQIQAYGESAAMGYKPHEYPPSMIEGVDLKTLAGYKRFLDKVFELVPEDIEKPVAPGPLGPIVTIPMQIARAHFVVQRIGYTPAVAGDFKETGRRKLAEEDLANIAWEARRQFFGYAFIVKRMGYEKQKR